MYEPIGTATRPSPIRTRAGITTYPDNHINKYQIARDADLLEFPGMDHLYIRLAWAYLEPKEGQFDWAVIDRIIEKWTAHGLGIAFRISCKETSTDRIEQQFATPRWVMEAGAQGRAITGWARPPGRKGRGSRCSTTRSSWPSWTASWRRSRRATTASRGCATWTSAASATGAKATAGPAAARSAASPRASSTWTFTSSTSSTRQLVISDDFVYALADPPNAQRLHQHVLTNGISYRDDSILVNGYLPGTSDTFTVRSPEFFADAYLQDPDRVRAGALRHGEEAGQLGRPPGFARSPSSARARPARTSSAARWSCCTPPTSATTATRTNGWPTIRS